MRAGILALILWFPAALHAEVSAVLSGEHAGFSRMVIQLPAPTRWAFGKSDTSYELRIADPDLELDTREVFKRIPHTRIAQIARPGPGRLALQLGCPCSVDTFELRPGRIVIDVRDSPTATAQPPQSLPPLPPGLAWVPERDDAAAHPPAMAQGPANGPDEPPANASAAESPPQPQGRLPSRMHQASAHEAALQVRLPLYLEATSDAPAPLELAAAPPEPAERANAMAAERASPVAVAAPEPASAAGLFQPRAAPSPRARELRDELLLQLSRASAEGLFTIPLIPDTARASTDGGGAQAKGAQPPPEGNESASGSEAPDAKPMDEGKAMPAPDTASHIEIRTAADLGRQSDPERFNLHGQDCLASEAVNIADWGPAENEGPFSNLRAALVGEFDKPDPQAVEALVRRYLHFGFGAEAQQVLAAWDVALEHGRLYADMAAILDGQPVQDSPLKDQASCDTDIALWGLLAAPQWPAAPEIDRKAVTRAFSALPAHLRRQLGPRLADGFISQNDLETAATIRDQILRAPGDIGEETRMLEARLARAEGRMGESQSELADIARSGGVHEAEALASLIETRLQAGETLDEDTALLADAMAVEYQDTEAGRRLVKAALQAIIATGHPRLAFERMDNPTMRASLDRQDLVMLRSAAHAVNARVSDDAEFLRIYNAYGPVPEGEDAEILKARMAVAERLLDLGLPESALSEVQSLPETGDAPALLRARALLAMDRGEDALQRLNRLEGDEADRLRVRALEQTGRLREAARLMAEIEPGAEAARLAWLAGDWEEVASLGEGVLRDAASLMLDGNPVPDSAPSGEMPAAEGGDQPPARPPTLAEARALLDRAGKASDVLEALLSEK